MVHPSTAMVRRLRRATIACVLPALLAVGILPLPAGLHLGGPSPSAAETTSTTVDSTGRSWAVGLKPDGTALVRVRAGDGTWSDWFQQGSAGAWDSMSIEADNNGRVLLVGVKKNSGQAMLRTRSAAGAVGTGWSDWTDAAGGWASMSVTTDVSGKIWMLGVKKTGAAFIRSSETDSNGKPAWSRWLNRDPSLKWVALSLATDKAGNVWLAGVLDTGVAYVRTKGAGGAIDANWSPWVQQGSRSDWASLNVATDSMNNVYVAGTKRSGTGYVRMKKATNAINTGWSTWLQLGTSDTWASVMPAVDRTDTLWLAGVKRSGTAFVRMHCFCNDFREGWSSWMQQGEVNSWKTMSIATDPANRVIVSGVKLSGTAVVRVKDNQAGVTNGWSGWGQQGPANAWASFTPHSDTWVGSQAPIAPTLNVQDPRPVGGIPVLADPDRTALC